MSEGFGKVVKFMNEDSFIYVTSLFTLRDQVKYLRSIPN